MQIQAEIEDPTHLKLRQPLDAEVGSVIVLEIVQASERDEFLSGSAALLERAYGDDEPDYSNAGTPITVS
ncbi:MAG: hypothetical protein WD342_02205 [Verrucomicrobiales bacterium]